MPVIRTFSRSLFPVLCDGRHPELDHSYLFSRSWIGIVVRQSCREHLIAELFSMVCGWQLSLTGVIYMFISFSPVVTLPLVISISLFMLPLLFWHTNSLHSLASTELSCTVIRIHKENSDPYIFNNWMQRTEDTVSICTAEYFHTYWGVFFHLCWKFASLNFFMKCISKHVTLHIFQIS